MMKLKNSRIKPWLVLACGLFLGCDAKEPLAPLKPYSIVESKTASLRGEFCTTPSEAAKSNLKIIFVVDKSGSNQDNIDSAGTDQNGQRRYQPLEDFVSSMAGDESVYYRLVNFSTAATAKTDFMNDHDAFLRVIQEERTAGQTQQPPTEGPVDGGWTDFRAALDKVNELISADIDAAKSAETIVSSYYVVFFVSDGAPYIEGSPNPILEPKSDVVERVERLVSLREGAQLYVDGIQIHTGYYFNSSAADGNLAQEYMTQMAEKGEGQFLSFSGGQLIDFKKFALPTRNVKYALRDVIVSDLGSVWEGNRLEVDTDGDGVSDAAEVAFGSNPENEDSDGNHVSDGIEVLASGKPCKDAHCSAAGAEPYGGCAAYRSDAADAVRGMRDLDSDGLNDCEEIFALKSKRDDFDSNGDWVPDVVATRTGIAFLPGSDDTASDGDGDGVRTYLEIKNGTPPRSDNRAIQGIRSFDYIPEKISEDASQTCYRLNVNNVALLSSAQKFKLYFLENTSIIDTKRKLRSVEVSLHPGETTSFAKEDLK